MPRKPQTPKVKIGIGRTNAVTDVRHLPGVTPAAPATTVEVLIYYAPTGADRPGSPKYNPENPRLKDKLKHKGWAAPTQEQLAELLAEEVDRDNLLESAPITGGWNEPIIVTKDGYTDEGNRRLYVSRKRLGEGDRRYEYVLVEEWPQGITPAQRRASTTLRHIRRPLNWDSPDQSYELRTMIEVDGWELPHLATWLGKKPKEVTEYINAGKTLDQYAAFIKNRTNGDGNKGFTAHDRPVFTHFLKMNKSKTIAENHLPHTAARERIFAWMHDGKLGECCNIDNLTTILGHSDLCNKLDGDTTFSAVYKEYTDTNKTRRNDRFLPNVKAVSNHLRRMTAKQRAAIKNTPKELEALQVLYSALQAELLRMEALPGVPKAATEEAA